MADEIKSGTETVATETGENNAGQVKEQDTAFNAEAGEQTDEQKQAAEAKEAEEAAERERIQRENTPGTLEYHQAREKRARESKKKLAIDLQKEKEARIRAEEREKLARELLEKGIVGKVEKVEEDPKPVRPKMKDFESQEEYEAATEKYEDIRFQWERRQMAKESPSTVKDGGKSTANAETTEVKPKEANTDPFIKRRDEIGAQIEKEFGNDVLDDIKSGEFVKLPVSTPMTAAIWESEHAAKIIKHLVDNPGTEEAILKLGTRGQVAEIEKIEKIVSATPTPRTPKAPEPVKPVSGGSDVKADESKLSDREWRERRMKQKLSGS